MMINIWVVFAILFLHFMGDFIFQSDWMATNKSKNVTALAIHALVYSACFVVLGTYFAIVTFVMHFFTDGITSQWTSKLWFAVDHGEDPASGHRLIEWSNTRHWFFVVIGLDQLIHFITLLITYRVLA